MILSCNVTDCKHHENGTCSNDYTNVTVEVDWCGSNGTVSCSDYKEREEE